jgi:GntR family transcriptional regulator
MPIETPPPKYAAIINAIQARIEAGSYPGGSLRPSEAALAREFGASRSTVVRALEFLRERGWVDAQQGRGRTVLGRPPAPARSMPERVRAILTASEQAGGTLLAAGPAAAPARAAAALRLPEGAAVVARRLLVRAVVGPVELLTAYVPAELAVAAGLAVREPLRDGLLSHLRRHGVSPDHVLERISARPPTTREARLLEIGSRDCLLTVLWTVCDRAGHTFLAVDAAFPQARRSLEDTFHIA